MKSTKLLYLFTLLVFLASCGDDDDGGEPTGGNFTVEGETYPITEGYLEDYGENTGLDSHDWDVYLVTSGITVGGFVPSGSGNFIYLDLNTTSSDGLVAGTYTYSDERDPFTLVDAIVGADLDFDSGGGDAYEIDGGTVTVSIDGDKATIDFNLDVIGGGAVTGSFTGVLSEL